MSSPFLPPSLVARPATNAGRGRLVSRGTATFGASLGMAFLLAGCGGARSPDNLSAPRNHLAEFDRGATGGDDQLQGGVNAYLWRGALDTLSFMPLASADAVGGVILTDWYEPPATSGERFKIAAYVLDRRLRSDALRISVFRQVKQDGEWADTPVAPNTVSDITTRILKRARQLRSDNGNRD